MSPSELRGAIMGSLRVAMLGMVKPNLRCVLMSYGGKDIHARFVCDEIFTPDDVEDVSCIETELVSHFFPEFSVQCLAESVPPWTKIGPRPGEVMVFHRAESRDYRS